MLPQFWSRVTLKFTWRNLTRVRVTTLNFRCTSISYRLSQPSGSRSQLLLLAPNENENQTGLRGEADIQTTLTVSRDFCGASRAQRFVRSQCNMRVEHRHVVWSGSTGGLSDVQVAPGMPPIPTVGIISRHRRRDRFKAGCCTALQRIVEAGQKPPNVDTDHQHQCAFPSTSLHIGRRANCCDAVC